ncbi:hypothetical protein [Neotamlana laminarinivorans]|uniref:Uncharacterized protein n=1 Tax=Neotamlana laminarinivorans TaxID=2883124 RepID=A0A9X1HXR6_9FLAO|nr:hypothetical protein [Tamlana laminarinivorans]MCB4798098.1 hypothetical protein [Tamlana laminarinivorans]
MALSKTSVLGIIFFLTFVIQFLFKLNWEWLFQLQQQEMYKRWTGLLLAVFVLFQWLLSLVRTVKTLKKFAVNMQEIHKWLGAISPLLFYIHSIGLGYGYLLLLSYIFLANTVLGYFNLDVVKKSGEIYFKGWMIAHVALSLIIAILMVFHITMVFYYK